MTLQIAATERLTIVKFLAGGRDLEFTATATGHTRDEVLDVARHHGYPDVARLKKAAKILEDNLPTLVPNAGQRHHPAVQSPRSLGATPARTAVRPAPAPAPPRAPAAPPPAPAAATGAEAVMTPALTDLLRRGSKSEKATTRALAKKISDTLPALVDAIAAEQEEKRAAAARAAEEARARSEIARLEAELAAARALLGESPSRASRAAGITDKEVRSWAKANGIPVAKVGRVNQAVIDQYLAAHRQDGAA